MNNKTLHTHINIKKSDKQNKILKIQTTIYEIHTEKKCIKKENNIK